MHVNFLIQITELLEHNDSLRPSPRRSGNFINIWLMNIRFLRLHLKEGSNRWSGQKRNLTAILWNIFTIIIQNMEPILLYRNWKINSVVFGILLRTGSLSPCPDVIWKIGENVREEELRYLYEIANILPGFLEERGFTAEPARGVQESTSPLLSREAKPYYRDYICNNSEDDYQSLHITFLW